MTKGFWLDIVDGQIFRSYFIEENDKIKYYWTGSTLVFCQNRLLLLDVGRKIDWDLNTQLKTHNFGLENPEFNIGRKIMKNLHKIESIDIILTHFHPDHVNGIDDFFKFCLSELLFLKNPLSINIYIYQPQIEIYEAVLRKYFELKYYRNLLKKFNNVIHTIEENKRKGSGTIESSKIIKVENNLEKTKIKKRFIESIIEKRPKISIFSPSFFFKEINGFKIQINYFINEYSFPKNCNISLRCSEDYSHTIDHNCFILEINNKKITLIHLGDCFPFIFALSDIDFSNERRLVTFIEEFQNIIIDCLKNERKIIITYSHVTIFNEELFRGETFYNIYVNTIEINNIDLFKKFIIHYYNDILYLVDTPYRELKKKYLFARSYFKWLRKTFPNRWNYFLDKLRDLMV